MRPGHVVGPLILVGVGILFLVNNLLTDISLGEMMAGYWWLVLIVVGLAQLAGVLVGPVHKKWGHLNGGLILLTVGGLFGIQHLYGFGFGRTWPVLLIVIGLMGMLRLALAPVVVAGRVGKSFRRGIFR